MGEHTNLFHANNYHSLYVCVPQLSTVSFLGIPLPVDFTLPSSSCYFPVTTHARCGGSLRLKRDTGFGFGATCLIRTDDLPLTLPLRFSTPVAEARAADMGDFSLDAQVYSSGTVCGLDCVLVMGSRCSRNDFRRSYIPILSAVFSKTFRLFPYSLYTFSATFLFTGHTSLIEKASVSEITF